MRHSGYKIKSDIHCIQSSLSLTRIHAKLFVQRLEHLQTNRSVMLGRISCSYFGTSSNTQTNATYIKEHKSIQREKAPQRPKVKTHKGRKPHWSRLWQVWTDSSILFGMYTVSTTLDTRCNTKLEPQTM